MTLQLTPVAPDCADCLTGALHRAGFDWQSPFTLVGRLREVDPAARHALLDALIEHAEGEAFLIVTAPHLKVVPAPEDVDELPTEEEQEQMLTVAAGADH